MHNDILENKRILLVMPKFFGYETIIKDRLTKKGAIVKLIYEDMDEVNYFFRFVNAYFHRYMKPLMDAYFFNRIKEIASELDYVLIIRGEFFSRDLVYKIKRLVSDKCKFCMYQWDSVKNNYNALEISDLFDSVGTFDEQDAMKYNWTYRPLFYIPEMVKKESTEYDILYLCSLHSKRIDVLNRLKGICKEKNLKLYKRVYSKKIIFYKRKYLNKRLGYVSADNHDIDSKKMDITDTYKLYNKSKVVVDYTHPNQNGFTMRTIEALGCGRKLITNNQNIINADFYNPDNVLIYKDECIEVPDDFVNKPYQALDKKIYDYYSVDSWLDTILQLS